MEPGQPDVVQEGRFWVVRIQGAGPNVFEYRYASQAQARYFAAVFALGPRTLPAPSRKLVARAA